MSKIQDALDKIKASQLEAELHSANVLEQAVDQPGSVVSVHQDDMSNVKDMNQPTEMTTEEKSRCKIVDNLMTDRKAFNAIRDFRTTVLQRVHDSSPIIMVTSCLPGGGSSFVSLNLATAIAMDEAKTSLLIDCNLQNADYKNELLNNDQKGLKDYLKESTCGISDIIHPTGIPRLRTIPTGLIDIPMAEYFTSARLRKLFMEVKSRYSNRYIIVDAPPIIENADSRILAQVCDYVILVVPYGKVTEDKIISTARTVGKDKLLGVVFNNQPKTPTLSW